MDQKNSREILLKRRDILRNAQGIKTFIKEDILYLIQVFSGENVVEDLNHFQKEFIARYHSICLLPSYSIPFNSLIEFDDYLDTCSQDRLEKIFDLACTLFLEKENDSK